MPNIILFGASGFVGQSLAVLLKETGHRVVAHSSQTCDLTAPESAIAIAKEIQDGDSVILLSGLTPEKGEALDLTFKNLLMAKHLLAGLEGKQLAQFVYISSDAVYPLTADMVDEKTPCVPYALYGQMHLMREQMFKERFAPERLTIWRPCAIYGPKDSHHAYGINRFIKSAVGQGKIELFGGGEEYRDHIHVDDFAEVVCAGLRQNRAGLYNVASGESWRFLQIAQAVGEALRKPVQIIERPRAMPIYHRHVDTSLVRSSFSTWQPRSIGEGITQLVRGGL